MQRNALPIMAELAKDEERSGEQGGPHSSREGNKNEFHDVTFCSSTKLMMSKKL